MPNLFHQSIEDILRAATPEQKIIWNYIFLRYGDRAAVSQLHYSGTLGVSELNLYVARKMYFALQLTTEAGGSPSASVGFYTTYDEANAIKGFITNSTSFWDATAAAARYVAQSAQFNNLLFSRLTVNAPLTRIEFIGYRIVY